MKVFTDLNQSKKLAKILPLESADMYYFTIIRDYPYSQGKIKTIAKIMDGSFSSDYDTPCWSLAALLGVLPKRLFDSTPKRKELYLLPDLDKSYCFYRQFAVKTKGKIYLLTEGECLVDACYEMILKLHELKMLQL